MKSPEDARQRTKIWLIFNAWVRFREFRAVLCFRSQPHSALFHCIKDLHGIKHNTQIEEAQAEADIIFIRIIMLAIIVLGRLNRMPPLPLSGPISPSLLLHYKYSAIPCSLSH